MQFSGVLSRRYILCRSQLFPLQPHHDYTFTPIFPQIRFHASCDQDFQKFRNFIGY
ncbi:hypothetical protein T10_1158 [Trichinella papuae]|uniref:Uncharacterized protein n=1 Tax=Trichinella papuae TaxID=268474 RepID=A0A0V1MYC4_9BILA|nr:hypothetical protein T10_71 [Trichinella papuae]KRZ76510.1 hypothetical protein T10_1158 [Trichinella papuae]